MNRTPQGQRGLCDLCKNRDSCDILIIGQMVSCPEFSSLSSFCSTCKLYAYDQMNGNWYCPLKQCMLEERLIEIFRSGANED